jgi:ABC-type polysaccharide/polyol phosphate transport system ATPase subunit
MSLHTVSETSTQENRTTARESTETVRLEKVGVCYRVSSERVSSFKEYVIRRAQGKITYREFWALRGVDLSINKGEVLGLIGHNGAGKSTMLKLIARVLRPTEGRVIVRGKVAPLLEYGAGFHADLSGRENIFLNGAILGFTQQEMAEKFDRIVDFAELRDFIDVPMRNYSSGMWARLGFAVATDVQPDVLIIDEVLSVGDEAFQRKSAGRMQEFRDNGATILFVSHNMSSIEMMCHRVAWIDHGQVKAVGDVTEVIDAYRQSQGV